MTPEQIELAIIASQHLTRTLVELRTAITCQDRADRCQVKLETLCILMERKMVTEEAA